MSNLLGISLEAVPPNPALIARLLAAARRNLADARLTALSPENRFDVAYKAIMQIGMAALNAHGCRPLTSRSGHHQTMIQTMTLTLGLDQDRIVVLDALRRQRNLADYSGETISESIAIECLASAEALLKHADRLLH